MTPGDTWDSQAGRATHEPVCPAAPGLDDSVDLGSEPSKPVVRSELAERLIASVEANPGITTNNLVVAVARRKVDVLAALKSLEGCSLRFETGERGSKCWYPVAGSGNQFPTCSWGTPDDSGHVETETMP